MSYYDVVFYILICLKKLLTAMMPDKIKSDVLLAIRIFVSVLYMQEDSNMNNSNSAFCRQFAYRLCSTADALLSAAWH